MWTLCILALTLICNGKLYEEEEETIQLLPLVDLMICFEKHALTVLLILVPDVPPVVKARANQYQIQGVHVEDEHFVRFKRQTRRQSSLSGGPRRQMVFVSSSRNPSPARGAATTYYYPPKKDLPLPKCFYNPTGYVCCNKPLNNLIVETYVDLHNDPNFNTCNLQVVANKIQKNAERRFNVTFETIAGFQDFAQKIHFNADFVCKVELGGKFMLAYGTVREVKDPKSGPLVGPEPFRRSIRI